MNYATFPGFGDAVTWGGRSPETDNGYSGDVFFDCYVNNACVEVTARVTNDEILWGTLSVVYKGVEVSALIGPEASIQIDEHFKANIKRITEAGDDF